MPDVSVVIVTYERANFLSELVARLKDQSAVPEIVVVDDGTRSPVYPSQLQVGQYRWVPHTGYHRVARYNEGVQLAQTPFVILLDDDMLPYSRHFVQAHLEALSFAHACRGRGIAADGSAQRVPWFSTANLGLVTGVARDLGPFDIHYDGAYGYEDHDLGLALERGGYSIADGSEETAALHRGVPYSGDKSGMAANKAYYCRKWGIPNA